MSALTIDAFTFDVSLAPSVEACASVLMEHIERSTADILLFPEYTWAPALNFEQETLRTFWTDTVPDLVRRIDSSRKLLVLGTAPCIEESTQTLRNRALILSEGRLITQDKLFLTPWESAFTAGDALRLVRFRGITLAVIICLDIEMPELSAQLRGEAVDLILVPSATETILGAERVTRCASARAVELGASVVVSPLVGRCKHALVDENLGKLAAYHPSQAAFTQTPRFHESEMIIEGIHKQASQIHPALIARMRQATSETNPSLLSGRTKIEPIKLDRL